jgi:predicted RNA-binding protein with RPS1 domain
MKVVGLVFLILELSAAFQPLPPNYRQSISASTLFSTAPEADKEEDTAVKTCFWQTPIGSWEQRLPFESLKVGQELKGVVFQELSDGKTGGKLFMDCGVGRIDSKGDWQIVTGMHRIRDRKKSVIAKKALRLRQRQGGLQLWVSRIYAPNFQFEVVVREEDVPPPSEPRIPASSLEVGQELVGTVVRVESYGVFVDVGANRNGLLHIQRVADLFDHYIHKEEGLVEAGLEKGAKIRVAVASNEKKRLFLDFPDAVKADAKDENSGTNIQELASETTDDSESEDSGMSEEEMAAWAEFAAADTSPTASISNAGSESVDDESGTWAAYGNDDDNDDYEDDEDRDIEDALGIGAY